ncbi:hypothetical protein GCM10010336_61910 [Streptomyces goshikiensis]|nr:hypothetical protein GCM10010336_61910 [Streptomyces goshikiensis]
MAVARLPDQGRRATDTPHLNCAATERLPAVPSAAPTLRASDESDQPQHEDRDRDPPENLHRETRTEEDQNQQKNKKQGNHVYQPPKHRVPDKCPAMRANFNPYVRR